MSINEIQLFQILKQKLGDEEAQSLVEFVESKIEKQFDAKKDVLATKEDLAREVGNARADMIKWIFIFWIGQVAATIAIVKFFI